VVRRADRLSLTAVENALLLAAARRSERAADAPPLGTIRSLAYFAPVIGKVLRLKVGPEYFQHSATNFSVPLPPDCSVFLPFPTPPAWMMTHAPTQILFFRWVNLTEHYGVIFRERRRIVFRVEDHASIDPSMGTYAKLIAVRVMAVMARPTQPNRPASDGTAMPQVQL
jgi:hypothetical protein